MDLTKARANMFLQINKLDEIRLNAYESSISYKERTKRWHDKRIKMPTNYEKGDKVLLFNSRLRLFPRKLKSRWYGPFSVSKDMKNGAIELYEEDGNEFIVNKQRVKPYQKDVLDTNRDDDITLEDEGEVTKFFKENEKIIFSKAGDGIGIYPDGVYSMLRDYVVELQSTNPNATVKIAVKRSIDPSLPTRVFQRIYVCLGALKLGFRACRRELLGLDGAFMKGPFLGQVLATVGLDSNNGIYPLAYALVELKSRAKSNLLLNNISVRKWELTGIPCKHVVATYWNMALNDRVTPPLKAWVNPCYWLTTWRETYSHKVGRPEKKRKKSKHEDEPFVKDGKLSKKGRTITCQSYENIRHNKATCKGKDRKATTGGNNAEASGSAYRQPQQPAGQYGSGGLGVGAVIGLSTTDGQGGGRGTDGAGVGIRSQGSSHSRWTKRG
ncbi:hypothetical protein Tco_0051977 [Tanacetum coccineum]